MISMSEDLCNIACTHDVKLQIGSQGGKRLRSMIFFSLSIFCKKNLFRTSLTDDILWFPYNAQTNLSKPCEIWSGTWGLLPSSANIRMNYWRFSQHCFPDCYFPFLKKLKMFSLLEKRMHTDESYFFWISSVDDVTSIIFLVLPVLLSIRTLTPSKLCTANRASISMSSEGDRFIIACPAMSRRNISGTGQGN